MNAGRIERFDAIARLFRYPGEDYPSDALALAERLENEGSAAAKAMKAFAKFTERKSCFELEETYTRTFDLNPSCSPEIGWHLFGEEYIRGLFMVHMRNQMRERGLEETNELPDHVVHVLAVLAVMDAEPAREMARACVCPAIGKMLCALERGEPMSPPKGKKGGDFGAQGVRRPPVKPATAAKKNGASTANRTDQPFYPLVTALAELLLEEFDLPRSALEAKEEEQNPFPAGVDPLHNSPCGGCGGPEVVPLAASDATAESHEEHRP